MSRLYNDHSYQISFLIMCSWLNSHLKKRTVYIKKLCFIFRIFIKIKNAFISQETLLQTDYGLVVCLWVVIDTLSIQNRGKRRCLIFNGHEIYCWKHAALLEAFVAKSRTICYSACVFSLQEDPSIYCNKSTVHSLLRSDRTCIPMQNSHF